jgi:uncharacterized damage-inducible protein DinB
VTAGSAFADHVRDLGRYATRANARLYARCAELPDDALRRATDTSLGSVLAILEHVLAADRIWMARLFDRPVDRTGLLTPTFERLAPIHREREVLDTRIERQLGSANDAFLTRTLKTTNGRGEVRTLPARVAIAQMFNHQTHHRGQVHVLLHRELQKPLALDLHVLLREDGDPA